LNFFFCCIRVSVHYHAKPKINKQTNKQTSLSLTTHPFVLSSFGLNVFPRRTGQSGWTLEQAMGTGTSASDVNSGASSVQNSSSSGGSGGAKDGDSDNGGSSNHDENDDANDDDGSDLSSIIGATLRRVSAGLLPLIGTGSSSTDTAGGAGSGTGIVGGADSSNDVGNWNGSRSAQRIHVIVQNDSGSSGNGCGIVLQEDGVPPNSECSVCK
jgi:hypothetical protein